MRGVVFLLGAFAVAAASASLAVVDEALFSSDLSLFNAARAAGPGGAAAGAGADAADATAFLETEDADAVTPFHLDKKNTNKIYPSKNRLSLFDGFHDELASERLATADWTDFETIANGDEMTVRRLTKWRATVAETRKLVARGDAPGAIRLVNRWLNMLITYKTEAQDDWKSIARAIRDGGDCEDIALAKYETLKEAGLPVRDMIVTWVRAKGVGPHMVLLVRLDGRSFVLDNFGTFRDGSRRGTYHYTPGYGFNDEDLHTFEK
eukprot:TRINITY_DN59_c5_g1_i1.p2 TRINITY_DN59_c5_g1~~TRINITY_DN59_c5_g1_i1.p2  ORF type:complete len:265 (+),score=117.62 TRINITY_DN59_c5_g1_i1:66-860(+)